MGARVSAQASFFRKKQENELSCRNCKEKEMLTDILELTKTLVRIRSVNGTAGEAEISKTIHSWFEDLPYFHKHPENLFFQPIPGDTLGRGSVIALVEGTKNPSDRRTLLLHGHTDTVGTGDFGYLEKFCTDPDALAQHLKEAALPDDVKKDLESGDFLFGRGAVDMKSGDAVFMEILKYFSTHPEELSGNLLGSFNPVEENAHTGIITSLPLFLNLEKERGLSYIGAVNNDFTTRLFPGDDKVTLYTGAGGKILPCFYIRGKETHVGQPFEGLDASALASELLNILNLSTVYADTGQGEMAPPPSVLKLKDLKDFYNVQTAKEALIYFNYYVYEKDMPSITEELLAAARKAGANLTEKLKKNHERFCRANDLPFDSKVPGLKVMSYADLIMLSRQKGVLDESALDRLTEEELEKGTEKREVPLALIRSLLDAIRFTDPVIVLYYAPPFVPHCRADRKDGGCGENLYEALAEAAAETGKETGQEFRILNYYPSLSDSSYLKIDDDTESLQCLKDSFPEFDRLSPLPLEDIQALDIPAINIGTYGSDAHKWTERVNIPYTFGILPKLEMALIRKLLG